MENQLGIIEEYLTSPSWKLLGFKLESCEEGVAILSMKVKTEFLQSYGQLQGGYLFTLLDAAGVSAAGPNVFPRKIVTLEAKINYIRPGKENQRIFGKAEVVHCGRSTAITELKAYDEDQRLLAIGTATFSII